MLQSINVLIRPHPYNCHSWDPDPLASVPGAVFFPRTGYDPMDEENRADFFDSIYHSAAVVGINTSAMIEAAIIGRPVFSLLAEEFAGTQQGLIHFHYLASENGGCVRIASMIDDHIRQLSECLRDLADAHAETERFISHFVRPHGLDRPATPIFVDSVERLAAAAARAAAADGGGDISPSPGGARRRLYRDDRRVVSAASSNAMAAAKEQEDCSKNDEARRPDGSAHRASWSQAGEAVARGRSAPAPRSQVNVLQRIAEAFSGRSVNERLAGLEKTVRKLEETDRHSLASLDRRLTDLARAVAEQPTAKDLRELRQAVRATTPQHPAQWLFDRIDQIVSGERLILIGPWTGEVGFELLYWIPFVRWVRAHWAVPPERELIVSRGGVGSLVWATYDVPTPTYSLCSLPKSFAVPSPTRSVNTASRVRSTIASLKPSVAIVATSRLTCCIPALMHRLFASYWSDESGYAQIDQFTRHQLIEPPGNTGRPGLPSDYVAIRFYFNECFPATSDNRAFARSVVSSLAERSSSRHSQSRLQR